MIRADPWWTPRYPIPLLGMVLGNALTGISLGLERCLSRLSDGREYRRIVACGRGEAVRAGLIASEAVRAGLIPILNSMSVAGLVTIPGDDDGQILGGMEPGLAAQAQS